MMNSGREMTASEETETAWSSGRPARTADTTPRMRAMRDHQERRDRREDEGVDDLRTDLVPDRRLAPRRIAGRRVPEIAGQNAAEPVEIALVGRAVEPHRSPHLLELLRRRRLAEDGAGRVPWKHLRADEDEDRDDEERRNARREAAQHEAEQRTAPPGGRGRRTSERRGPSRRRPDRRADPRRAHVR